MGRRDRSHSVDAFGVLASETRLAILETVWAYQIRQQGAISYSRLKDEVGVADSGKFNYHLDKLRGGFITEEPAGYVPETQARAAIDALQSKRYHEVDPDFRPVEGYCPVCGGRMGVGYHWNFFVGCGECWEPHLYRDADPGALEARDWREVMLTVNRGRQRKYAALLEEGCPDCGAGGCFRFVSLAGAYENAPTAAKRVRASVNCRVCMTGFSETVGGLVLAHPRVRAYCDDHGIDLDANPFWCHDWVLTDWSTTVRSEDPWRVEKVATVDGCRLAVVFADDGRIETVTHVDLRRDGRDAPDSRPKRARKRRPGERAGPASDATPGDDDETGNDGDPGNDGSH